jgi:hypothetical protein
MTQPRRRSCERCSNQLRRRGSAASFCRNFQHAEPSIRIRY